MRKIDYKKLWNASAPNAESEFNYQPDMLANEIYDAINRMSGGQRKAFLSIMKTLAAHSDMRPMWQNLMFQPDNANFHFGLTVKSDSQILKQKVKFKIDVN